MPARMHREKTDFQGEQVYRYMICCKRCVNWSPTVRMFGTCAVSGDRTAGQTLSCQSFEATGDGECGILLETARIDKDMAKLTMGDVIWYCTQDEVEQIKDLLGIFT